MSAPQREIPVRRWSIERVRLEMRRAIPGPDGRVLPGPKFWRDVVVWRRGGDRSAVSISSAEWTEMVREAA